MSRFRRSNHEVPGLNTASLPDLVFTVLFFFMIVTHIRDTELRVEYDVPQGQRIEKAERKRAVVDVHIGRDAHGNTRIQLGDRYATVADIGPYIRRERSRMAQEDAAQLTVSIKADRHTRMGVIEDVKRELSAAGVQRVIYAAEGGAGQ